MREASMHCTAACQVEGTRRLSWRMHVRAESDLLRSERTAQEITAITRRRIAQSAFKLAIWWAVEVQHVALCSSVLYPYRPLWQGDRVELLSCSHATALVAACYSERVSMLRDKRRSQCQGLSPMLPDVLRVLPRIRGLTTRPAC